MMMYTDTTRGRNAAKDPAVIRFQGKYFMYYSLLPGVGNEDKSWGIGIAVSGDLENWNRAGELGLQGEVEKNGICAPAALLYDGMVHLFYQTYGNNEKDAICHAWSQDGIHFTRDETNPVVRADSGITAGLLMQMWWFSKTGSICIMLHGIRKGIYRCLA